MTDFYKQNNFLRLKKKLKNDPSSSIIPFVGAGLSIFGEPKLRLPTWKKLIELLKSAAINLNVLNSKQLNAIDSLLEAGYFDYAAEIVVESLPSAEFRRIFHEAFNTKEKTVPPAILQLLKIPWKLIITTNYDNFIENNWLYNNLPILTANDLKDVIYLASGNNQQSYLLKIHGTIERVDTWVFTDSQYDKLIVNNYAYENFIKILLSNSLLFIGFGMKDRDFNPLLQEMLEKYPAGFGNHFALIDKKSINLPHVQQIINAGIQPIYYESDDSKSLEIDCGHGEVLSFIKELTSDNNNVANQIQSKEPSVNYLMESISEVKTVELKKSLTELYKSISSDSSEIEKRTNGLMYLFSKKNKVSRVAVLAFINNQEVHHPHAIIEVVIVNEDSNVEYSIKIGGPVIMQPEKVGEIIKKEIGFDDIPDMVFRELIVNAIYHRKYDIEKPIVISISPSSIIISNPGTFGIPIGKGNEVWKNPMSVARNPELAMIMNEFKYAEQMGFGLISVARAFTNMNRPLPIIETDSLETKITILRQKQNLKVQKTKGHNMQ